MAQTTPPTVDPLGPVPSTATPANFDTNADSFLGALPTFRTQLIALGTNLYNNAVDAFNNAVAAAASAVAALASQNAAAASASSAASSAGAPVWANTGASYAIGDKRSSPANGRIYYRLTAGTAGTTDPSVDSTNWKIVLGNVISTSVKTGNYTASVGELVPCDTTAGPFNVTLPASMAKDDFVTVMDYAGKFATNNLTVLRNGKPMQSLAEDCICDQNRETRTFVYIDATQGLEII